MPGCNCAYPVLVRTKTWNHISPTRRVARCTVCLRYFYGTGARLDAISEDVSGNLSIYHEVGNGDGVVGDKKNGAPLAAVENQFKPIDLKQRKAELEAELAKLIAEIELVTMSQVTQPGEGEGIGV